MKVEQEVTYAIKILFIMIFNNDMENVAKEESWRQHLCGNNMLDRESQLNVGILSYGKNARRCNLWQVEKRQ